MCQGRGLFRPPVCPMSPSISYPYVEASGGQLYTTGIRWVIVCYRLYFPVLYCVSYVMSEWISGCCINYCYWTVSLTLHIRCKALNGTHTRTEDCLKCSKNLILVPPWFSLPSSQNLSWHSSNNCLLHSFSSSEMFFLDAASSEWGLGGPPAWHCPRQGQGFVRLPLCPASPTIIDPYGGPSSRSPHDSQATVIRWVIVFYVFYLSSVVLRIVCH